MSAVLINRTLSYLLIVTGRLEGLFLDGGITRTSLPSGMRRRKWKLVLFLFSQLIFQIILHISFIFIVFLNNEARFCAMWFILLAACRSSLTLPQFAVGKYKQSGRKNKPGLILLPGSPCNNYKGSFQVYYWSNLVFSLTYGLLKKINCNSYWRLLRYLSKMSKCRCWWAVSTS